MKIIIRSTSGTHGYMAPEVYIPPHKHGTTAEWFSLGVTLHEMLTGYR
jgi:serine/threonine protein kinase